MSIFHFHEALQSAFPGVEIEPKDIMLVDIHKYQIKLLITDESMAHLMFSERTPRNGGKIIHLSKKVTLSEVASTLGQVQAYLRGVVNILTRALDGEKPVLGIKDLFD